MKPTSSTSWSKQDYLKIREYSISKAKSRLLKTQERYKRDFNKKVNTLSHRNFRTEDLVFVNVRDIPAEKFLSERRRNKLDPETMGPFVVIEYHGHTLDIDVNGIPECITSYRARPAPGNVEYRNSDDPDTDSITNEIGEPIEGKTSSSRQTARQFRSS